MPTSQPLQINQIIGTILNLRPQSVLDIGVGFGKYGFLTREYLELWKDSAKYDAQTIRIDGIEAFGGYITPLHKIIYNNIYVGEGQKVIKDINYKYDLILLIDVIEHFSKDQGLSFINECLTKCTNLLVSTPKTNTAQGAVFGNAYETHLSHWNSSDFSSHPNCLIDPTNPSLIVLLGDLPSGFPNSQKPKFSEDWAALYRIMRKVKDFIRH